MTELKYRFTYDTLFKLLFVNFPGLLKRLVAAVLAIPAESITEFEITNPEIPPESLGDKFCRLDINMRVNGQRVNLEVQVANEGDYPERTLYHWAREYSSALQAGSSYSSLPRTIIISIVDFPLFDCTEYHSEFRPLEVRRYELLSDKMTMHYFELRKLPRDIDTEDELELMLSLFGAKTEEELKQLEALEVPIVNQAIGAYREITVSPEFRELERLRSDARHNEASALQHARQEERELINTKWQGVVADRDAALADRDAAIADRDAEIARLRAKLDATKQ
ncbi:MAG: Rpn family recombination-promoting nuclease/putative transposase [Coriobacteriales bacterium]|jgi:predicted transposase/invertase (TIGR01784 family)|nr:Rpn family recombination-promoting nuclease/putative transposase [Coriobacteriales bacterium]